MDKHIELMGNTCGLVDGDLMLCHEYGVAFQRDMTPTAHYNGAYFEMYAGYANNDKAEAIDGGRIALVARHAGPQTPVCDVGIGAGVFISKRGNTWGVDVNPVAQAWLKERGLWAEDLSRFSAFTFFDVLEHLPEPGRYLQHVPIGGYVFASLPIFDDLNRIRESRHYKPGEHLLYFTENGFIDWMWMHGFKVLERTDFETVAGRESILSFAFQRFA